MTLRKKVIPAKTKKKPVTRANWQMGKGRIKGTKNKFTTLKKAFLETFENMGGAEGLLQWAMDENKPGNRKVFYYMIARMLPREVQIGAADEVTPNNYDNLKVEELDAIIARYTKRG